MSHTSCGESSYNPGYLMRVHSEYRIGTENLHTVKIIKLANICTLEFSDPRVFFGGQKYVLKKLITKVQRDDIYEVKWWLEAYRFDNGFGFVLLLSVCTFQQSYNQIFKRYLYHRF